jgi:hypothetical protein
LYHIFQIIYDFYGLVQWSDLEKKQKKTLMTMQKTKHLL